MKKYSEICPQSHVPALVFDRPELQYPQRLNAVEAVLEGALRSGWQDRTAFYADGKAILFGDVHRDVHRYAAALREIGVECGDAVILHLPDTFELVAVLLAVQVLGAIAVPTYVQLRAADLIYRANDTDARYVISTSELVQECEAIVSARNGRTEIILTRTVSDRQLTSLQQHLPRDPGPPEYADTHSEDLCLLLYTSGSTSAPKGTCHCHRDMLAIADSYWRNCMAPAPDDVVAGPPSIAFAMGFGLFIYFPLRLGHAAVIEPDKSPQRALELIARHHVTIFIGVTSYYNALIRLIEETGPDISSLRHSLVGGEPLTPAVERHWAAATGLPLEQFIGTTEMLHIFVTASQPDVSPGINTLGKSVPGYDVAVLDPQSFKPVPNGVPGLLAVRGPTGTVYWNKPDQQSKVVINGWNVFQDLVTRGDEDTFQYITRYDDMIVSSGHNISPIQVEDVLMRHDDVAECACVAAPDPTGQRSAIVKAYVVTNGTRNADDVLVNELQNFVKTHAPPYMYPRAISFVPALPKTINGKILRSELRERAAGHSD